MNYPRADSGAQTVFKNTDLLSRITGREHSSSVNPISIYASKVFQDVDLTPYAPFRLGLNSLVNVVSITIQPSTSYSGLAPGIPPVVIVRDGAIGPRLLSTQWNGDELLPGAMLSIELEEIDFKLSGRPIYLKPENYWIMLATPLGAGAATLRVHVSYGVLQP